MTRVDLVLAALKTLGVSSGRQTRYGNNTGTCLWCDQGSMVMVPDEVGTEVFVQGPNADELGAILQSMGPFEPAPTEGRHGALIAAGEALFEAGIEEGLVEAREVFQEVMRSYFEGHVPGTVQNRIRHAGFEDLKRFAKQLKGAQNAMLVVV